uniref:Copine family member IX n=1 Tax=Oryzias sinensis TaxID=183150 RepID=A0A8C7YE35_9TELE
IDRVTDVITLKSASQLSAAVSASARASSAGLCHGCTVPVSPPRALNTTSSFSFLSVLYSVFSLGFRRASRGEMMASIGDFDPLNTRVPATKIEVTVSCRNLLDFGRTEVIDNTRNPDFVRKFVLDFFFEEKQNLRFDVYNVDSRSCNISKHDFLGQTFCTLGEIIGSTGGRLERTLSLTLSIDSSSVSPSPQVKSLGKKCGVIILTAEELSNCRDIATMQLCANKLDKKDFFGKSDPFLVFYRSNEDGTFTICHKTEVIKNTLNPVWQPFTIPVRALCNGDYDRTVKVDVYDWDRDGRHDFIGEFTTSYRELSRGQNQFNVYEVLNPKKKGKKKKYINSGTVGFCPSSCFLLSLIFLCVFKGNPSQPTSLHYMSPYQMNAYAMALKAVGEIIQDYDSDKLFPAYGFGAKLPPDGKISHAFPLNGDGDHPNCVGIEGVLEAYFQSLRTVQLYGPTNFAPVINKVANCAAEITDGSQYFVLLMITDGVISDMVQTKEAVVNAAALPLSIIIVGVGPAEFDAMEELDGDEVRVSSRGRLAERDIVQFVPFRDYVDRSGNQVLSMARLAKDVLAEIPDQLLSFMKSRGVEPRPALSSSPLPELHRHI